MANIGRSDARTPFAQSGWARRGQWPVITNAQGPIASAATQVNGTLRVHVCSCVLHLDNDIASSGSSLSLCPLSISSHPPSTHFPPLSLSRHNLSLSLKNMPRYKRSLVVNLSTYDQVLWRFNYNHQNIWWSTDNIGKNSK